LATVESELVNHAVYRTRQEAMTDIFFYIEGFCNRTRRHSALGYLSPANFEATHAETILAARDDFVSIKPG